MNKKDSERANFTANAFTLKFLLNGPFPASFSFKCCLFKLQYNFCTTDKCEKGYIKYVAMGFKLATS